MLWLGNAHWPAWVPIRETLKGPWHPLPWCPRGQSRVTCPPLILALCSAGFHLHRRLPGLMPESCLLILVGALVGAVIFGTDHKSPPVMDSSIYFLYLLPPIVLESGYFMPTRPFFENLGSILWWAGLGALLDAFGIGLSLYLICQVPAFGLGDINLLQNLLFGSLISAVDPVAVLAVFEEARVNEQLYMMIFGEALLNDGISVVRCPRGPWGGAGRTEADPGRPGHTLPVGSAGCPHRLVPLLTFTGFFL